MLNLEKKLDAKELVIPISCETKWSGAKRPYSMELNDYLTKQNKYESNARSYPRRLPLAIAKAEGLYVEDTDGRIFIDCLMGAGSLALGHNHDVILDAMRECLDHKRPLHTLDITSPVKDEFVHTVLKILPKEFSQNCKFQFCSPSGSDAIEAAIKLVKTYTGRSNVFTFKGGYHGMSHGALALTGAKSPKALVANLMKGVEFLPYPYHYRCPFGIGGRSAEEVSLHYIENILKDTHSGVLLPAAFILEIVQGEGGVIPASNFWLKGLRDIATRYEIPLIIDEVQTGIGRTGKMFAFEHSGIMPDVLVVSKAIGGSLPLSMIIYKDHLDKWEPGAHAGTFRGNQMAMAAGTRTIEVILENDLLDNVNEMGDYLTSKLCALKQQFPLIGEVRGKGLMIGIEIIDPRGTKDKIGSYPANPITVRKIHAECFKNGLIIEIGGRSDSILRLLPPLTLTKKEADIVLAIVEQALENVAE